MRILKESYTEDEVRQRAIDTRNIFEALVSSLYILATACEEADFDRETNDRLSRYAEEYVERVRDLNSDFFDDFEEYIEEKQYDINTEDEEEIEVDENEI